MCIHTNQVPGYSSHRTRGAEVTWSDRMRLEAQLECPRPLENVEEVSRLLFRSLPGMTSVTASPPSDITTLGSSAARLPPKLTEDKAAGMPPLRRTRLLPTCPSYSLGFPKYSLTGPSYLPTPPVKDKQEHPSYMDAAEVTWSAYNISFIQNIIGGGGRAEVTRPAGDSFSTKEHMLWWCTRSPPTHRAPCRTEHPSLVMPMPQPEPRLTRPTWRGLLLRRPT